MNIAENRRSTRLAKLVSEFVLRMNETPAQSLKRRLATCGDSTYPYYLARQDMIEAEQERTGQLGEEDEHGSSET